MATGGTGAGAKERLGVSMRNGKGGNSQFIGSSRARSGAAASAAPSLRAVRAAAAGLEVQPSTLHREASVDGSVHVDGGARTIDAVVIETKGLVYVYMPGYLALVCLDGWPLYPSPDVQAHQPPPIPLLCPARYASAEEPKSSPK